MQIFAYKAISKNGSVSKGLFFCQNQQQLKDWLLSKNLILLNFKKKYFNFFTHNNLIESWLQALEFLLKSKLNLKEALEICLEGNKKAKFINYYIINQIQKGHSLSKCFEQLNFPKLLIAFLKISESTGNYLFALESFNKINKEQKEFKQNFLKQLIYPAILIILSVIMLIGFSEFLLPNLKNFLDSANSNYSYATRVFFKFSIAVSNFFKTIGIYHIAIIGAFFFIARQNNVIKNIIDLIFISTPLIGKNWLEIQQSFFLNSLSVLMENGYTFTQSLEFSKDTLKSSLLKSNVDNIEKNLTKYNSIASALSIALRLNKNITQIIHNGEQRAKLSEHFLIGSIYLKQKCNTRNSYMINLISPLMILAMGIFLSFMVYAIILPIYNTLSTMEN